jgi:hypothetical protein
VPFVLRTILEWSSSGCLRAIGRQFESSSETSLESFTSASPRNFGKLLFRMPLLTSSGPILLMARICSVRIGGQCPHGGVFLAAFVGTVLAVVSTFQMFPDWTLELTKVVSSKGSGVVEVVDEAGM